MSVSMRRQFGTSIIELLVATLVTAIGVLGLSKLQVNSLVNNQQSQYLTLVSWQLYQMAEKMRANNFGATSSFYLAAGVDRDCITAACTSQQMAESDVFDWNTENAALFPSGAGTITQPGGAGTDFVVTIRWDGNRIAATGTGCDPTDTADLLCNTIAITIN